MNYDFYIATKRQLDNVERWCSYKRGLRETGGGGKKVTRLYTDVLMKHTNNEMKSYCNGKKSLPQRWTVQGPKGSLSVSDSYPLCSINLLLLLLSKLSQFYLKC